jgi:hypothetical protein
LIFVADELEFTTRIVVTSTNDSHVTKNDDIIVNTSGVN